MTRYSVLSSGIGLAIVSVAHRSFLFSIFLHATHDPLCLLRYNITLIGSALYVILDLNLTKFATTSQKERI